MRKALVLLILLNLACTAEKSTEDSSVPFALEDSFTTPLGKTYSISEPSDALLTKFEEAKADFETNPNDLENIIWYGRRTAYLGQYRAAIAIYSDGIELYPEEPKLYRHRGHRYISLREYDLAIADFEKAAELIQGTENEIEPDGMPNALNIPVSTLHGNIYYHLGLAYYLTHKYDKAYEAYIKCRESGSRYDNIVSSTHWLYMIQQRLENPAKADSILAPITSDSTVIENQSYADLCLLYKGQTPVDSLLQEGIGNPSNDAVRYGVANWYLYNGDTAKAILLMEELVESKAFSSFGYLAAESDLMYYFKSK
ncbi:tetratricopeptide repeat protein [Algoriphagus namhaensis]|uniref:Tetratricopeptide repeat protein n=1 Tax=Algoriphagus namhaensis TaxID=915353 RepID=A0ABV8AKU5_9BACT